MSLSRQRRSEALYAFQNILMRSSMLCVREHGMPCPYKRHGRAARATRRRLLRQAQDQAHRSVPALPYENYLECVLYLTTGLHAGPSSPARKKQENASDRNVRSPKSAKKQPAMGLRAASWVKAKFCLHKAAALLELCPNQLADVSNHHHPSHHLPSKSHQFITFQPTSSPSNQVHHLPTNFGANEKGAPKQTPVPFKWLKLADRAL